MEKYHFNIPLKKWVNITKIALIVIDMQKGIKNNDYTPLKCERFQGLGEESKKYIKDRYVRSIIFLNSQQFITNLKSVPDQQ